MSINRSPIGTVISDRDTPTFETIRIKLKAGKDVKPGTLVRIDVSRTEKTKLIGRIRSAYENNPDRSADRITVSESLNIPINSPTEEQSTRI